MTLLALPAPLQAQFDFTDEAKQAVTRALAESRSLAQQLLPGAEDLGPDWKQPWQLPERFRDHAASEDDYWRAVRDELGAIGLDEPTASGLIDQWTASLGQLLAAEGGSTGDALKVMIMMVRSGHLPPAQELLEGLETAVVAIRQAAGEDAADGDDAGMRAERERRRFDLALAPLAGLDEATLRRMALDHATLVQRRLHMRYYHTDNWNALLETGMNDRELVERGLWLAVFTVDVMLLAPNPLRWPPDHTAADLAWIETEARRYLGEILDGQVALEERRLAASRQRVEADAQRQLEANAQLIARLEAQIAADPPTAWEHEWSLNEARGRPEKIERERRRSLDVIDEEAAALAARALQQRQDTALAIRACSLGDHCESVRFAGTLPGEAGIGEVTYSTWLRNGRAATRIELKAGNAEAAPVERLMDDLLALMHAKTVHYGVF